MWICRVFGHYFVESTKTLLLWRCRRCGTAIDRLQEANAL